MSNPVHELSSSGSDSDFDDADPNFLYDFSDDEPELSEDEDPRWLDDEEEEKGFLSWMVDKAVHKTKPMLGSLASHTATWTSWAVIGASKVGWYTASSSLIMFVPAVFTAVFETQHREAMMQMQNAQAGGQGAPLQLDAMPTDGALNPSI
jgi:hypothetical protein